MYVLELFGGIALRGPGGPLSGHATQSRQLALLALLGTAGDAGLGREKLLACLWPESSDASARHSLTDAVYRLRKDLGRDAVLGSAGTLRLNPDVVRCDVREFEDAVAGGDLERAAELFRGPFLDGFHLRDSIQFEDWREGEARRLGALFEGLTETLAEQAESAGDPVAAVERLRRLSEHDPFNSRTAVHLVRAQAAAGDPANALLFARQHAELLRRELGVEPPDELLDLAEELRAGRYGPAARGDQAVGSRIPRPRFLTPRGRAAAPSAASEREVKPVCDSDLLTLPRGPAIAVLPFRNLSGNPEDEFFTDGITGDIITGLTRFTNLFVMARSSTARFRGERVDVREVGRELGVPYALLGGIRRSADHLRVNAELVDTAMGVHLWAESYDRDLTPGEIFQVQDDITNRVVATLAGAEGVLTRSGAAKARAKPTGSLAAYEAVLRVFSYWDRQTPAEHLEVREALERALDLDPEYAPAWACLSILYLDEYRDGFNPRPEPLERALRAARRATELDPAGHHSQHALAQVHFYRRERDAFFLTARKAVRLNPNDCTVVAMMGLLTAYAGEWEAGIAMLHKAMALNPYHPGWYYLPLAFHRYRARDYEGALKEALKVEMPGYWPDPMTLAAIYGQQGRPEQAGAALGRLLQLFPSFQGSAREELGKWLLEEDVLEHMLEGLEKAGLDVPDK